MIILGGSKMLCTGRPLEFCYECFSVVLDEPGGSGALLPGSGSTKYWFIAH